METTFGLGNVERQVANELNAAAEYLVGIARDAADAATPVAKAGATVAVAGLALGVMALPAAGTFTLLSATMALSGSVAGLSAMAAMELAELNGMTVPQQSREAIDLAVDLGGSPFKLGFGVASAASFGAHELERGVEIGRLVNIAADLKSLVTSASQIEQGSSAVGLLTELLQFNRRKITDTGNKPDGAAVPRSEARVDEEEQERARAAADEHLRLQLFWEYQRGLIFEAQLREDRALREARAEAERRQFEEQLRRDREESERKAREAEQLRKAAEEARQRAAEAEERARQESAERQRWLEQQEEQRHRQAQLDAYAVEAENLSRLLKVLPPSGSFGVSSGPPAPNTSTGPVIGPT